MSYDSNLKGWAIDRAIETLKLKNAPITGDEVIALADQYCKYTYEPISPAEPAASEAAASEAVN